VDKKRWLSVNTSLQFNNLHFNILFTEKCNTSSLCSFTGPRERGLRSPTFYGVDDFFSDVFLLSVFDSYLIVFSFCVLVAVPLWVCECPYETQKTGLRILKQSFD